VSEDGAPQARGGFFAIDRRTWALVCGPDGLNEAVAYLVLACGTGRDNRTSTWSVQAIEGRTGISRSRAATAIKNLQDQEFIRKTRGGTRPRYELAAFGELPEGDPRPALTADEAAIVDLVQGGSEISSDLQHLAEAALAKGWLAAEDGRLVVGPKPRVAPDFIWLPKTFVDGAAGETAPLELIRETQEPMALRLLVDLYYAQNLLEDGGVARRLVWQQYDRVKIAERAQFTVWGFTPGTYFVDSDSCVASPHQPQQLTTDEIVAGANYGMDFFRRLNRIADLGLIEWIPHLVESAEPTGEIIHALGTSGSASIEDRLGRAAKRAARALLTPDQRNWVRANRIKQLAPVPRHVGNVQLVGIGRLRYRPHTRLTAAWWADLQSNAEKHLAQYRAIVDRETSEVADGKVEDGKIKEASRIAQ
jgi:hypothetical protein